MMATPHYLGVLFALVALVSWGFGDFFIQRTTRIVGIWKALFFIGVVGFITLLPFVKDEIFMLEPKEVLFLTLLSVVVVFTALVDFKALKEGKIAIVEPLIGLELPITVGLTIILGREGLSAVELTLIATVFVGIVLSITIHHRDLHYHRRIFEKGVILAGIGALGMALTNFLVGISSQRISPLTTIWFAHSLLGLICGLYLLYQGELKTIVKNLKANPYLIAAQSILDNAAWVAFAFATTAIPIAIATTVSESYIVLAVLLGIFVNREKLRPHQIVGIVLAIGGVIALSALASP